MLLGVIFLAREAESGRVVTCFVCTHHIILRTSEAHLGLFGGKKSLRTTRISTTTHNHLTSIHAEIDCHDDGNVLIARELSNALLAKICWGILTP